MEGNSTYEKIEAYLLHQMTEVERADFEAEVQTNKSLARQLERHKLEHKLMESLVEKDLMQYLKKWNDEEDSLSSDERGATDLAEEHSKFKVAPDRVTRRIPLFRRRRIIGIAASLLFLISLLFFFNGENDKPLHIADSDESGIKNEEPKDNQSDLPIAGTDTDPSNEKVQPGKSTADENMAETPGTNKSKTNLPSTSLNQQKALLALAQPYMEPVKFGTTSRSGNNSMDEALMALDSQQYASGMQILFKIASDDPGNLNATYYLALAYYQQERYSEAIPYFEAILKSGKAYLYEERIAWLLTLSYLQTGKVKEARSLLESIVSDAEHSYAGKGKQLLSGLKNLEVE